MPYYLYAQDTKGLEGAPPPPLNPFLRPVKPAKRKHVEQRSENPMQVFNPFLPTVAFSQPNFAHRSNSCCPRDWRLSA